MASMTLKVLKQRREEAKSKSKATSKKIENQVLIELKDKLDEYLAENDKVMIEVNPKVLGEFINILSNTLLVVYEYEQIDTNKFVFMNKEIIV